MYNNCYNTSRRVPVLYCLWGGFIIKVCGSFVIIPISCAQNDLVLGGWKVVEKHTSGSAETFTLNFSNYDRYSLVIVVGLLSNDFSGTNGIVDIWVKNTSNDSWSHQRIANASQSIFAVSNYDYEVPIWSELRAFCLKCDVTITN